MIMCDDQNHNYDDDYEHYIDDFDDNCDVKSHVMFGYHENCDFDDNADFDLSSLLKRIQNTGTKRQMDMP